MNLPARASVCHGCKKALAGRYLQVLGTQWHPECWRCAACGKALSEAFVERGGRGFHPDCHAERFGMRCSLCKEVIQGKYFQHEGQNICERDYLARLASRCSVCNEVLLGVFKVNHHGQKVCARHEQSPCCVSCGRWLERHEQRLAQLTEFGTVLCSLCQPRAIREPEVRHYDNAFGTAALKELGLDLGSLPPVPIRVDTVARVDTLKGPLDKEVFGITQTEVSTLNGVESARIIRAIVVVGGLAKEHFEGVLAHEFGHVWLFRKRLDRRPAVLIEGFCELVRYRWLSRLASPLAVEQLRRMLENPDPIYGAGFRETKDRWDRAGLQGVLSQLG